MTVAGQRPRTDPAAPPAEVTFTPARLLPPGSRMAIRYGSDWRSEDIGRYREGAWVFTIPSPAAGADLPFRFLVLDAAGHVREISQRQHARLVPGGRQELTEREVPLHRLWRPLRTFAARMDRHRTTAAAVYSGAALVLALAALSFGAQGYLVGDVLRAPLALILLGLALALAYESHAVRHGRAAHLHPTIARVAGLEFLQHPAAWLVVLVGLMGLAGALVIHFTSLLRFQPWVLGVAVAAYAGGAFAVVLYAGRHRRLPLT